jgi:hypothetical protein
MSSHEEHAPELNFDQEGDRAPIIMDDGMEPIPVPSRITRENFQTVFGQGLPEGLSEDMFDEGGLELSED